jgi:hypothetical protein
VGSINGDKHDDFRKKTLRNRYNLVMVCIGAIGRGWKSEETERWYVHGSMYRVNRCIFAQGPTLPF